MKTSRPSSACTRRPSGCSRGARSRARVRRRPARAQAAAGRLKAATDARRTRWRPGAAAHTRPGGAGGFGTSHRRPRSSHHDRRTPRTDRRLAAPDGDAVATSRRRSALAGLARRASALRADLSLLVAGRGRERALAGACPQRRTTPPVDVARCSARSTAAEADCPPSATLTVARSFDYLRARVGLGDTASDATLRRRSATTSRRCCTSPRISRSEPRGLPAAGRRAQRPIYARSPPGARCCLHQLPQHAHRGGLREVLPFPLLVQENARVPAAGVDASGSARCPDDAESGRASTSRVNAVARRHGSDTVRGPRRSLTAARIDRIREDGGDVQRLPAAARGAEAGDSAVSVLRAPTAASWRAGWLSRASLRRDVDRQPAARLPAHRSLEDRVLDAGTHGRGRARRRRRHESIRVVRGRLLAGSIPFGALPGGLGIDLRQVGSFNIRATNVARAMGKGWAVADAGRGRLQGLRARVAGTTSACRRRRSFNRRGRDHRAHVHGVLRGRGGKGSRHRWASRWRCRRSRRWSVSSPTPWSSRPRACRRWDRCWASGRSRCCSRCASSPRAR